MTYELTEVALKKIRANPAVRELVLEQLEGALTLRIHWHGVSHSHICRLAFGAGLSTYDASYLFLSRALRIPLLTFAQQLAIAAARP